MAETVNEIRFTAAVEQVRTLTDGGIRVTLDLPETAIPQMAMLAECKREGIPLVFTARVDDGLDGEETENGKRRKRKVR
jgi:hypothetical protein